jgi:hypothetical protein
MHLHRGDVVSRHGREGSVRPARPAGQGELFALDYDLLLYDVTSVYFEGAAEGNPLAQRGHRRDHRAGLAASLSGAGRQPRGVPIGYEVFAGNRTDVTTVEDIVEAMEAGLAARDGPTLPRGHPKSELRKWAGAIADATGGRSPSATGSVSSPLNHSLWQDVGGGLRWSAATRSGVPRSGRAARLYARDRSRRRCR